MCGRTSCHLPRDVLTRACAYQDRRGQQRLPEWRDPDKYCPSYNKSPQSNSPVLLSRLHFVKSGSIGAADSPENWGKVWDNWRLLTMAGIFDCWEPPEGGDVLYSYTIITVDSCKGLSDIHHRMPAILDGEEAVSKWLDFGKVSTQEALKLIHPTENITFHAVSSVVNNSRNNTPECLAPVDLV
ncbi:HMCES isoform 4, partial [Pongo abelii]